MGLYNNVLNTESAQGSCHDGSSGAMSGDASGMQPSQLPVRHDAEDRGRIGILLLDGANYSAPVQEKKPVHGDLAAKSTFQCLDSDVFYERVEGWTFEVCKYGPVDFEAEELVLEKEGVVCIRGSKGDPAHMFFPNRRPGAANMPRPRRPTRAEDWVVDGHVVGVRYIYDSETVLANITEAMATLDCTCNVSCITSSCGFAGNLQEFCAKHSAVPCLMSSLEMLPLVSTMLPYRGDQRKIMILTANSDVFNENITELVKP